MHNDRYSFIKRNTLKLYEKLAEEIVHSIQTGVLLTGDKLPSVRQLKLERNVSASTVFEAYYLLEARGLITAKDRSGYYVTGFSSRLPSIQPTSSKQPTYIGDVDVSELVFNILNAVKNKNVVPLGSAFPSPLLFPLDKIAQRLGAVSRKMDPWLTVKDISPGDENLRRQIAIRYSIDGLAIPINEVIITSGALEGLNLCLSAVTQPGDTVLIESASFYAALQSIEQRGLKAVEVPSHPVTGVDLDALQLAIETYHPKACWLMTNFQNPTGSLMPNAHKKRLVELLTLYDIPLIEDDVYGELYFGSNRPLPAKAFDKAGIVMHCASFSKCLAPGYRLGWVAAGKFSKMIERLKLTSSIAVSVPIQLAIADYLSQGGYDRHLRKLRHKLMLLQMEYIEAIQELFPSGTQLNRPQGGYFLWIKLPDGVDALKVHQAALKQSISIAPGPMFSASRDLTSYIRINCGHPLDEGVKNALKVVGGIVQQIVNK
jgi:DNA-binding transcriptional MocR family regulator